MRALLANLLLIAAIGLSFYLGQATSRWSMYTHCVEEHVSAQACRALVYGGWLK